MLSSKILNSIAFKFSGEIKRWRECCNIFVSVEDSLDFRNFAYFRLAFFMTLFIFRIRIRMRIVRIFFITLLFFRFTLFLFFIFRAWIMIAFLTIFTFTSTLWTVTSIQFINNISYILRRIYDLLCWCSKRKGFIHYSWSCWWSQWIICHLMKRSIHFLARVQ